jgi:hypothetical protein
MPDLIRCNGKGCPFNYECERHTKVFDPRGRSSYFTDPPYDAKGGVCVHYEPNQRTEKKEEIKIKRGIQI